VWPYVAELFVPHPIELRLVDAGVGVDPSTLRAEFDSVVEQVLSAATLEFPPEPATLASTPDAVSAPGKGRDGRHTGSLTGLLDELQGLARAHREATW